MEEYFQNIIDELKEEEKKRQPTLSLSEVMPSAHDFLVRLRNLCDTEANIEVIKTEITFSYERVFAIREDVTYGADKIIADALVSHPRFLEALGLVFCEDGGSRITDNDRYNISKLFIYTVQHYSLSLSSIYPWYYALAKIVNARIIYLLKQFLTEEAAVLLASSANAAWESSLTVDYVVYAIESINRVTPLSQDTIAKIFQILIDNKVEVLGTYFTFIMNKVDYQSDILNNIKEVICAFVEGLTTPQIYFIINSWLQSSPTEMYETCLMDKLEHHPSIMIMQKYDRIRNVLNMTGHNIAKWW